MLDLIFESRINFRHNEPQESKRTLKLSSNTSVFSIAFECLLILAKTLFSSRNETFESISTNFGRYSIKSKKKYKEYQFGRQK